MSKHLRKKKKNKQQPSQPKPHLHNIAQHHTAPVRGVQLPTIATTELSGMGNLLEASRNRRRGISMFENQMQSRVMYLLRQQKKTRQSIEEKQRQLNSILQVRRRQAIQKAQKALLLQKQQRQESLMKKQSITQRLNHQINKNESLIRMQSDNKQAYLSGKRDSMRADKFKSELSNMELLRKQSTRILIEEDHQRGRQRISLYRQRQNSAFAKQYNSRISRQETISRQKLHRLRQLQNQQNMLLEVLQKSQQQEDLLHSKLNSAFDTDLKQLEKEVLLRKNSRASSRKSFRSVLSSDSTRKGSQLYSLSSKYEIYSSKKGLNPQKLSRRSSRRNSSGLT